MKQFLQYLVAIVLIIPGCSAISGTSKQQIETGIYNVRNYKNNPFYVDVREDSKVLNPLTKTKAGWIADTAQSSIINLNTANPQKMQQT
ncbi:MAG TPA: hypothetical protein VKA92_02730, partial [Segetibacter sp.]|nr:hypothetical protein [Segetibacter sp.]